MAVKAFINIKNSYPLAKIYTVGPIKDSSYGKTINFVNKKIMLMLNLRVNYQKKSGLNYVKNIMYL